MRFALLPLLSFLLFNLPAAQAAFILDEFDDPAHVVSPEMEGGLVETSNVGDLHALRKISIFDVFNDPTAQVDINSSGASQFTGTLAPANSPGLPRLAASYTIEGPAVDFTASGANNALLVDFTSVIGATPPPLLSVLVENDSQFYEGRVSLEGVSAPTTIPVLFDDFRIRGGGSEKTDFRAVSRIRFDIIGNGTINGIQEQGWTVQIDRIRVGRIPEPTTICLLAGVVLVCASTRILR